MELLGIVQSSGLVKLGCEQFLHGCMGVMCVRSLPPSPPPLGMSGFEIALILFAVKGTHRFAVFGLQFQLFHLFIGNETASSAPRKNACFALNCSFPLFSSGSFP